MFARVYFGAHWIGDTLGGYAIGVAMGVYIIPALVKWIIHLFGGSIDFIWVVLAIVCSLMFLYSYYLWIFIHIIISRLCLYLLSVVPSVVSFPFDKSTSLLFVADILFIDYRCNCKANVMKKRLRFPFLFLFSIGMDCFWIPYYLM